MRILKKRRKSSITVIAGLLTLLVNCIAITTTISRYECIAKTNTNNHYKKGIAANTNNQYQYFMSCRDTFFIRTH